MLESFPLSNQDIMPESLNDLSLLLINGQPIIHSNREFRLKSVDKINGAFKAYIISERMTYSHAELASTKELAVLSALRVQQSMGRFCSYTEITFDKPKRKRIEPPIVVEEPKKVTSKKTSSIPKQRLSKKK